MEIVRPAHGFPGYTVSTRGSVYGKLSKILRPSGPLYKRIVVCTPDKARKSVYVHRLVCITYLDQ